MIFDDAIGHREWTKGDETGSAIPCVVTGFDLSGDPLVSVKAMMARRVLGLEGEIENLEPLDIDEVPYCYPSGPNFAFFVPPAIGMQGFLIVTDSEIGEAAQGVKTIVQQKDPSSGFFIPSGNLSGNNFRGNQDWAELRSENCRIALSHDVAHIQSGTTSITLNNGKFDVVSNGVSLIDALKELSSHVRSLETLVHPDGNAHTGPQQRLIDTWTKAIAPSRQESGVR